MMSRLKSRTEQDTEQVTMLANKISAVCDGQPERVVLDALISLLASSIHAGSTDYADAMLACTAVGFDMAMSIREAERVKQ